jgi:ADP-ribose pyrophosphatase
MARREYIRTLGAAAVVALDDAGRVVLVRQYRHAVGRLLWELPAGLLDVAGEEPVGTAQRELAEEVDLVAGRWHALVELHPSPGNSDEPIWVFLARDLTPVPDDARHHREDEEAELRCSRVDLDEAAAMVLRGEITNAAAVAGLLAAARARDLGWAPLRGPHRD